MGPEGQAVHEPAAGDAFERLLATALGRTACRESVARDRVVEAERRAGLSDCHMIDAVA